jgi:phosphatidylserine/phosphatidylglycerophosphate/cardiolipin synthase-like enzyme
MSSAFDGMSANALRGISAALRAGRLVTPLSKLSLRRVAPSCTGPAVAELVRLSNDGLHATHLALLVDAMADAVEGRLISNAELVWTGPESSVSHSRDTLVVVSELFRVATKSVLVSTFVIQRPDVVFRALADRMIEVPDLRVQIFVHVGRNPRDTRYDSEILREFSMELAERWPGPRRPFLYYHPLSLSTDPATRANWHAKAVVVDDEISFVTSANFTEWAHERNVEAGVLIRSASFARQLRQQFDSLVQSRAVLEVPEFRS